MRRFSLVPIMLMIFLGLATAPAPAEPPGPEVAQGGNVMQCMERCIRNEGKAEMDTCKMRCANVSSQRRPQKDCMSVYKSCQSNCRGDKACQRSCKSQLMQCS